jgi:hypothetical protein
MNNETANRFLASSLLERKGDMPFHFFVYNILSSCIFFCTFAAKGMEGRHIVN